MPSTEHVVLLPPSSLGELDWTQLQQHGQAKVSADGQQVFLTPQASAIHLQHSHGAVASPTTVQLPWPALLARVDLTATAGWSALLDSCQGSASSTGVPTPLVNEHSPWMSSWLSQPGVHVRAQVHANPEGAPELQALGQVIPTISALLNSATIDSKDATPPTHRLARLMTDPKAWVQLSATDYYMYVDSWALPDTSAATVPMDWVRRMNQSHPWLGSSGHETSFDHTLHWTLSLTTAPSQPLTWAIWSWSTLPAEGLQISICDIQKNPDRSHCDQLTLLTSTTHANTATYQGLAVQPSPNGPMAKALRFADVLPPITMMSHVTMEPPSSLHPHMVTSFLASPALGQANLEDRPCQPKLLYHIAPTLFADPYQLADQTPMFGPFRHYGPIELEKPVDLVPAWGSVVMLDARLPALTYPTTTTKARSNQPPVDNDGFVQLGWVDLPLHTRYKLPSFNTSATAMDLQVYSLVRRPMVFVQCYSAENAESRYPLGLQSVLQPSTKTTTALLNSPSNTTLSFVPPYKLLPGSLKHRTSPHSGQTTVTYSLTSVYANQPLHPSLTNWEGLWVNIPLGNFLHAEPVFLATHLMVLTTCLVVVGCLAWALLQVCQGLYELFDPPAELMLPN
ncbi:hypothetical protein H4R34_005547, partial [Dimargaris verticillata]